VLIGDGGAPALPWLLAPLQSALTSQRGHALLLHASPGAGALPLALSLAQSYLCEAQPAAAGWHIACGQCGSCKLVQAHGHPDLSMLLPETLRRAHGWPLADDKPDSDESKRKPSKQIRIDDVRGLIDWSTKTSARGRGKVAVVHPADSLNPQSANALLKTLEEPPPGTRLLLTTSDPALLLPTVRSRCQLLRLPDPEPAVAVQWLLTQGLPSADDAHTLLAASSGRPLDALEMVQAGIDAPRWLQLPRAVQQGRVVVFAGWPVSRVVDALQKLCHDAMAHAAGGAPRFFAAEHLPAPAALMALARWWPELQRVARHDEHPWHEPLLIDALVAAGAKALVSAQAATSATAARAAGAARPAGRRGLDTLLR
jgi:DNA polymerase III subunit delta'